MSKVARSRNLPTSVLEDSMTVRQIKLEFFFLQREQLREWKAQRTITLSAVGEAINGKG